MMSPLAALMASLRAEDTMRCGLSIIRKHGYWSQSRFKMSLVPSFDFPSATTISKPPGGGSCAKIDRRHDSICSLSLRQGTTIEAVGMLLTGCTTKQALMKNCQPFPLSERRITLADPVVGLGKGQQHSSQN